jgi:hypothetical protein
MGAEIAVLQILFLRAGMEERPDRYGDSFGYELSAWSAGIGVPAGPLRARFDYARVVRREEPRYDFAVSWEF